MSVVGLGIMALDKTYQDTWITRAEKLDGMSYAEFLKSPEWALLKRRAYSRPHFRRCWICGTKKDIDLHHTSYKWIDRLELRNVRPICRTHHEAIHRVAREWDISVRLATRKALKLYRRGQL